MEYLIALAGFLAGVIIGSMLQYILDRRGLTGYVQKLLVGHNSEMRGRLDFLEKKIELLQKELTDKMVLAAQNEGKITQYKDELELKTARITELEKRLSEVEKIQKNGH